MVHQGHFLFYWSKITRKIIWHWGARLSSWHLTLNWTFHLSWLHVYTPFLLKGDPANTDSEVWGTEQSHPKTYHTKEHQIVFQWNNTLRCILNSFIILCSYNQIAGVYVVTRIQDQFCSCSLKKSMPIIMNHLYNFISMTATQTEYNSVLYQIIKVISADWTKKFLLSFQSTWANSVLKIVRWLLWKHVPGFISPTTTSMT